jgi:hypothetical protein
MCVGVLPMSEQRLKLPQATRVVQFRVGIVQNNPKGLIDALYNVSMPDSPAYGQHLSSDEVGGALGSTRRTD